MKIIDMHLHFSRIERFAKAADIAEVEYSQRSLQQAMKNNDVAFAIGMGTAETAANLFPDAHANAFMDLDLQPLPENVAVCAGINPHKLEKHKSQALLQVEQALQNPRIVGIKIYLGYYPFSANHRVYFPLYELAETYGLPVVFHAGETYHEDGALEHAHPRPIDFVARRFRACSFVIAHLAYPWMMETAELAAKNPNVFTDLSGLIVGSQQEVFRYKENILFMKELQKTLTFLDQYDKILYGSDWPLVPMKPYIHFIQELIPSKHQEKVFYGNALRVFPRIARHVSTNLLSR